MLRIAVSCLAAFLVMLIEAHAEPARDNAGRSMNLRFDPSLSKYDKLFARPEDAQGLGVMVAGTGRAQLFMKDEIIVHPKSPEHLAEFLGATKGQLLDEPLPPNLARFAQ
jgi:hypothetical protein